MEPSQTKPHRLAQKIELWNIDRLKPYGKNPRTHSEEQVEQIIASIREFGFTNPILVDSDSGIIAGHGRLTAAKKMKLAEVPVIVLDHLTDAQRRAYIIADNKLALNAGWDMDLLGDEIQKLDEEGFDLDLLGFSDQELQDLTGENPDDANGKDEVPENAPIRAKLGDLYELGPHRLLCGDACSMVDVGKLMNRKKADMVFTDPPYGISVVQGGEIGHSKPFGSGGLGKIIRTNTYAPVVGDDSTDTAVKAYEICKSLGKVLIFWGGNYYSSFLPDSSCWIVWDKQNTGNFGDAELAWTNQNTPVRIFQHMWNGMIKASEHNERRIHPTQKPVALAEWCFEQYGKSGDLVLDLFGGSGSTLIACEKTKRKCYIMELDPYYCSVIMTRWENFTGRTAKLVEGE